MDAVVRDANASPVAADPDRADSAGDVDLICGGCGYDLRGIADASGRGRCPECGRLFDAAISLDQLIPWEQRRTLGWIRAYCRTVRWVTFQPLRFAEAMKHPISRAKARSFRAITIAIAFMAIAVQASVFVYDYTDGKFPVRGILGRQTLSQAMLGNPCFLAISAVALLLWLIFLTGSFELFFRLRQADPATDSRAGALSQYLCAPLAWYPLVLAAAGAISWWEWQTTRTFLFEPWLDRQWLLLFSPAAMLASALLVLQRVRRSAARTVSAAISWPIVWMVTLATVFVLLHGAVTIIALFVIRLA